MRAALLVALGLVLSAQVAPGGPSAQPAASDPAARPAAGETLLVAPVFDGLRHRGRLEVRLRDGLIVSIEETSGSPSGARFPGESFESPALLTPGLIDMDPRWMLAGEDAEADAGGSDLLLLDALALDEATAGALRRSGVTSAWLMGGPAALLGGMGALVQPGRGARPAILRERWGFSASLAADARHPERAPTSLPSQALLVADVLPGLPGPPRIRFDDGASLRHAARLGIPAGLPRPEDLPELPGGAPLLATTDWTRAPAPSVAALARLVTEGRLGLGSGDALGPVALRVAAFRLVEEGARPDDVLRALTSTPAAMMKDDRRGMIAAGHAADLVLWSGDPAGTDARPLLVFVAGEEIFRAP